MKRSQFLKVFTGLLAVFKALTMAKTSTASSPDKKLVSTSIPKSLADKTKSLDLSRLLRCIAEVETNNTEGLIGRKGERGRHQISESVFRQHYPYSPFSDASELQLCCTGHQHLVWLNERIPYKSPTERDFRHFALAYAWRAGLDGWNKHYTLPQDKKIIYNNYAVRVTNLYDDATFAPT